MTKRQTHNPILLTYTEQHWWEPFYTNKQISKLRRQMEPDDTNLGERERPFFACYAAPLCEDGISLRLLGDSNDASLWRPFHLLYCTLLIDGPIQKH